MEKGQEMRSESDVEGCRSEVVGLGGVRRRPDDV